VDGAQPVGPRGQGRQDRRRVRLGHGASSYLSDGLYLPCLTFFVDVPSQPAMFAVPKYAKALSALADERNVTKTLSHDLVEVDSANRVATFKTDAGELVTKEFDFLHAVPPQGPLASIKESPLADAAGWVSVSQQSLQHTKFANVFSLGDASSLATSKTAAAVTAQTPVVVENLKAAMDGQVGKAVYDGYSASAAA
jgi:NADPH-dependent 2,4-dienoyl-CoA reductase/sulfur reductase-like enzyme